MFVIEIKGGNVKSPMAFSIKSVPDRYEDELIKGDYIYSDSKNRIKSFIKYMSSGVYSFSSMKWVSNLEKYIGTFDDVNGCVITAPNNELIWEAIHQKMLNELGFVLEVNNDFRRDVLSFGPEMLIDIDIEELNVFTNFFPINKVNVLLITPKKYVLYINKRNNELGVIASRGLSVSDSISALSEFISS